jgi:hypothetical protein
MAGMPKRRAAAQLRAQLEADAPAADALDPRAAIIRALRAGATYTSACASAGVSRSTATTWATTDPAFGAAVEAARDGWAAAHVEFIASSADWRARAWLLERRLPREFGAVTKLAGHDGGQLESDAAALARVRLAVAASSRDDGES